MGWISTNIVVWTATEVPGAGVARRGICPTRYAANPVARNPSASYSLTMRLEIPSEAGSFALVNVSDRTFLMHLGGKIEVNNKVPIKTRDDLSMAYTPGVARVCMAIAADVEKARTLTIKQNTVAVVTDGTAVLGLGDIGPEAAMPVMEGKAMLF